MELTFDVPESIPLSKVREFVSSLGIDATYLREFSCGMNGVYIEVAARNSDGKPYIAGASHEPAVHCISIPLDREG